MFVCAYSVGQGIYSISKSGNYYCSGVQDIRKNFLDALLAISTGLTAADDGEGMGMFEYFDTAANVELFRRIMDFAEKRRKGFIIKTDGVNFIDHTIYFIGKVFNGQSLIYKGFSDIECQ